MLARWDTVQDMLSLREAMNNLLERSVVADPATGTREGSFIPALDLAETATSYTVKAAVPGLKAEDLNITVENNVLTLAGEIHREQESKEQRYHRVERRFGRFQRTITLPTTVKADAITANLTDGVLHIEIPKAEEVRPRRISINVNAGNSSALNNNPEQS